MISIRVWNVESDHRTETIKFLENEFLRSRQLGYLAIRSAGRSALRKCHRKGDPVDDSLRKAIQHYLNQDNYIVFVTDVANSKLNDHRLVNALKDVVKNNDFADKIYFAQDIRDSEVSLNTEWQGIVSDLHAEVDTDREQFQREWDKITTRFHDAFADSPEEEVIRDFEEALAEVRRERK